MKKLIFLYIFLIINLFAIAQKADTALNYPKKNFTSNFFSKWYLQNNFEHFVDNYYDFTIHQLETTGDYSQPNPYTFSVMGGSYKWNQYTYNGFNINDMFFPGNALHKPYMFDTDVEIDIYNNEIKFNTTQDLEEKVLLQWNHGSLGDRLSNADYIINQVTGHVSPYQRLLKPIEYRRKVRDNALLMLHNVIPTKYGNLYQNIYLNSGQRSHLGFNYDGADSYYVENYMQFHINGNLPLISKELFDKNGYLLSISDRDQLFSEYYYAQNETARLKNVNLSLYGSKSDKYISGINFSFKNIKHNQPNFSRNFVDVEGEGLEPWYADGNSFEISANHKHKKQLGKYFSLQADFNNGLMIFSPSQSRSYNSVYYQSTASDYSSHYYYEWQHNTFAGALLDNEAGIAYNQLFLNNKLNLKLDAGLSFDGFLVKGNSYVNTSWQLAVNAGFQILPKIKISVLAGKKQLPFDAEYIRFYSPDYMSANVYFWNDANTDKAYQANEKGNIFTTTGGKYHSLSSSLKQPNEIYFDVPIEIRAGKRSLFTITGQYRQYRDLWGITYSKPASEIGYYINENINIYKTEAPDIRPVYYLNPGTVNYTTANNYSELMQQGTGDNSFLYSNPFYSGLNLKYEYQSHRLYLSASFTAYMLVGFGSMGNGVLHNNLSVLSESMANPNTYFYYTGRLDADRSYIGRLLISYNVTDKLSFAFQYKYKDGQSLNSFGTAISNNQIAIWNSNVKGDNPFTGQLSRREDCFYNTEIRARYKFYFADKLFDVNLTVYNLLDLGFQLSEFTFPPKIDNGKRWVLETQIPRGFLLSATMNL